MDTFYPLNLFEPNNPTALWYKGGFTFGFFILVILTFLGTFIYYVLVGKRTRKYAHLKSWLFSLVSTMFAIFIFTSMILGLNLFEAPSITEIRTDVWTFSLLNSTLYSIAFFFLFSLLFRLYKGNNRSVPIGSRN